MCIRFSNTGHTSNNSHNAGMCTTEYVKYNMITDDLITRYQCFSINIEFSYYIMGKATLLFN